MECKIYLVFLLFTTINKPTQIYFIMKKQVVSIVLVSLLVACGTAKKSTEVKVESGLTEADVARVQSKFPGYTLNDLTEGKKLFDANCALCHDLPKPTSMSEDGWRKIVPPMVSKANHKNGNKLDKAAEERILKYLITMGPELKK